MSHEVVYTSAPRGLKPGTRGFCTVAATQGISPPLADRLEALSGYRHLFSADDARPGSNPVNYSHLSIVVGGRPYHVLSRIADAGVDYTQRTNMFAHHVALEASELSSGGPAWVMSQPGFFETNWDAEPKILYSGRTPALGEASPAVCDHWHGLVGDAGWAGVLAETTAATKAQAAWVLFEPGQDLLPLVAEALALLPPAQRWDVTFSTFFTKLPPGVDCQWRFVPGDSDEAKAASRVQGALVLDLRRSLSRAVGGELVEVARTGKVATTYSKEAARISPVKTAQRRSKTSPAAASTFGVAPREVVSQATTRSRPISAPRRRVTIPSKVFWPCMSAAACVLLFAGFIRSPAITNDDSATFEVGKNGKFTAAASGFPAPTMILESELAFPDGVSFDVATATLGGEPAAGTGGVYRFEITARNFLGSNSKALALTVNEPPEITIEGKETFTVGKKLSRITVKASGWPKPTLSVAGAPLPSDVAFDVQSGVLSGTPMPGTGGKYNIAFMASNGVGRVVRDFTLNVDEPVPPKITVADKRTDLVMITSPKAAAFTVGRVESFKVTASGSPPPRLTHEGKLPNGVSFNDGVLSGTPVEGAVGTYPIRFTASNGIGSDGVQNFTLTVNEPVPPAAAIAENVSESNGNARRDRICLQLPDFSEGPNHDFEVLTNLGFDDASSSKVKLALDSWKEVVDDGHELTIEPADGQLADWGIRRTTPSNPLSTGRAIGTFRIKDGGLLFKWDSDYPPLRNCVLSVVGEGRTATYYLRKAVELDPESLEFNDVLHTVKVHDLGGRLDPIREKLLYLRVTSNDETPGTLRPDVARVNKPVCLTISPPFAPSWSIQVKSELILKNDEVSIKMSNWVVSPTPSGSRNKPIALSISKCQDQIKEEHAKQKRAQAEHDEAEKELETLAEPMPGFLDPEQKRRAALLSKANEADATVQQALERMKQWNKLETFLKKQQNALRFTIYYKIGEYEIVLADTPLARAAPDAAK